MEEGGGMPVETIWEPRGVYNKYLGSISFQDIRQVQERMFGDARFDRLLYIINDYALASPDASIDEAAVKITAATAWGATQWNTQTHFKLRFALIATAPEILALIEHISAIPGAGELVYQVFPSLAEARAWIETECAGAGGLG
jgi:hypothetical protein